MNLYAIHRGGAPNDELAFALAESDEEAVRLGVFVAGPGRADVYCFATNVRKVGTADAAKDAERILDVMRSLTRALVAVDARLADPENEDVAARDEVRLARLSREVRGLLDLYERLTGQLTAQVAP